MKLLTNALISGSLAGFIYFASLWILSQTEAQFSALPDWIFRLILILGIFFALFRQRVLDQGKLGFLRGLGVGSLTGVLISFFMGLSIYLIQSQVNPAYNTQAKEIYTEKRREQMMANRLKKAQAENRTELNDSDKAIVENALSKHLEDTDFYFTPKGSMYATWIYSSFWIFGTVLTGAFLFQAKSKS